MADDTGEVDSPAQDDYVALADAIRGRLKKMAEQQLNDLKPDEVKWFIDACQALYWLEVNAHCLDHKIEHGNQCWGD